MNEQALSVLDVKELQEALNSLGFDCGVPDGRVGSQTRNAIRAYQKQNGLITDGYASGQLLEAIRN